MKGGSYSSLFVALELPRHGVDDRLLGDFVVVIVSVGEVAAKSLNLRDPNKRLARRLHHIAVLLTSFSLLQLSVVNHDLKMPNAKFQKETQHSFKLFSCTEKHGEISC